MSWLDFTLVSRKPYPPCLSPYITDYVFYNSGSIYTLVYILVRILLKVLEMWWLRLVEIIQPMNLLSIWKIFPSQDAQPMLSIAAAPEQVASTLVQNVQPRCWLPLGSVQSWLICCHGALVNLAAFNPEVLMCIYRSAVVSHSHQHPHGKGLLCRASSAAKGMGLPLCNLQNWGARFYFVHLFLLFSMDWVKIYHPGRWRGISHACCVWIPAERWYGLWWSLVV